MKRDVFDSAAGLASLVIVAGLTSVVSAGDPGSLKVIATVPGPDVDVQAAGAVQSVEFPGTNGPVNGFGITGRWISVVGDNGGGTAPWSAEFSARVTAPAGLFVESPDPWFGEISIAGYPIADAFSGFGGTPADGSWTVAFDTGSPAPWVAGLRDVQYHLLAPAPTITHEYTDTTDQPEMWNRPFSVAGVSGLGPVTYHVLEFEVSESGLYEFASILASGGDHWTSLYEGSFFPVLSLIDQADYGLGNGFSVFDVPRGESRFNQLLFEGTRYFWVTSQWGSFSAFSEFTNTIQGPGTVLVVGAGCNEADNAEPLGVLDLADVQGFVSAFVNQEEAADVAEPQGVWDLADVQAFVAAFNEGCP